MKKIIYIASFFVILILEANAQIGINTENPQTLFHIDILGNNTGTIPSVSEQADDVYMGLGYNNEAVISIGSLPYNNMQLQMTDPNKAFLPNKVALTSQLDIVSVPNPQTGMLIYNTATISGTNGVTPGLYVYESNKWQYLFTENTRRLQIRDLQTSIVTPPANSSDYVNTALMNFGDDILISEDGAYGVGINLYGRRDITSLVAMRSIIYVWLMADDVPVDVAELNPLAFPNDEFFTYTVFLGGQFSIGDKLSCRISHYGTTYTNSLYIDTSLTFMMYWRLEQASM